jgi:cytochrome c553
VAAAGLLIYKLTARDNAGSAGRPAAQYVGQSACAACHQAEAEQWRGSDHSLANGRMQALGIAWDSRSARVGGQRWFHLYPDEKITYNDPLHWTGPNQNWNYMCAECHSTNLQKNYDLAKDSYATTRTA